MVYKIYWTVEFQKVFRSLDFSEQYWIRKIERKLLHNPHGTFLVFPWFLEKKYLNKRLYYIVDDGLKRILFVAYGGKKEQQEIIDFVKENKSELFIYLRNAL